MGVAGGPGEDGGPAHRALPGGDAAGPSSVLRGAGHGLLAQNPAVQRWHGDGYSSLR